jgi:uncharacterized delta-60 repeat protein
LAAAGDLDPTFGQGGRVIVDTENDNDLPAGVALQPDGKIIVGRSNSSPTDDFSVLRFNPDGSPDTSFDADGRTSLDLPGIKGKTARLLRQPDGKIVAIGETLEQSAGAIRHLGLARYLEDGSPDPTFGSGGVAIHDVRYQWMDSVLLQPDGRLLVAGYAWRVDTYGINRLEIAVTRLEPDGSLDRSFGQDGYVFRTGAPWGHGLRLTLQSNGKLTVFADVQSATPKDIYDRHPAIMRFNADGSPDTAFGDNGRALILSAVSLTSVVTQSDGRMLLAAADTPEYGEVGFCGAVLTRLHPDGSVDDSFGINGLKQVPLSSPYYCETLGGAMLLDTSGHIVLDSARATTGAFLTIDSRDYVVTRLNSSGDLDRSFGVEGEAVLDVGDGHYLPYVPYAGATGNLLRQEDGKFLIITSGIRVLDRFDADNDRMVLARLQANGGSPGLIGIKTARLRARQSDGRIPVLIRRSGGSQGIVSVDYSTAGGASGFIPVSGTLTWDEGDRADKLIVIDAPGGFTLSLANPAGGARLATSAISFGVGAQIPTTTTTPVTTPTTNIPANFSHTGGGGALSWEVLMLMALGVCASRGRRRFLS